MIQLTLKQIVENYSRERMGNFSGNRFANFIRRDAKEAIETTASIDLTRYEVKGSAGQGVWAEVPWISVFDRSITQSATNGFYIVYLFRADMQGVYLSLNQGFTYYDQMYGKPAGRAKAREVSNKWRQILNSALNDFSSTIDLNCVQALGKGYEAGHICGVYYEANNIPNDIQLVNDLRNLMGVYRELKGHMGTRTVDQMIQYLLTAAVAPTAVVAPPAPYVATLPTPLRQEEQEEIEDLMFQNEINSVDESVSHTPELPQDRPEKTEHGGRSSYKRDPKKAVEALQIAEYTCEIDPGHLTFVSRTTGRNFVEAHHLVPMKYQDDFENSLDVPGNIVALCPNCHRAIHHAEHEQKGQMIKQLYRDRYEKLQRFGIDATEEKVLEMYGL